MVNCVLRVVEAGCERATLPPSLSLFLSVSLPSSTLSSVHQRTSALCYSPSSLVCPIVVSFFPCFFSVSFFPFLLLLLFSAQSLPPPLFFLSLSLCFSTDLNSTRVHVVSLRKVKRTEPMIRANTRSDVEPADVSRRSTPGLVIDTRVAPCLFPGER